MKQFIYPAICYKDDEDESITLLLPDIDVISSGLTCEDAFISAKGHLKSFVEFSLKFGAAIDDATSFKDICAQNPKKDVLLVDAETDAKKIDRQKLDNVAMDVVSQLFED